MQDRTSQIAAIEATFESAKQPVSGIGSSLPLSSTQICCHFNPILSLQIRKHYSKPGVVAKEVLPLFPDFDVRECTVY